MFVVVAEERNKKGIHAQFVKERKESTELIITT